MKSSAGCHGIKARVYLQGQDQDDLAFERTVYRVLSVDLKSLTECPKFAIGHKTLDPIVRLGHSPRRLRSIRDLASLFLSIGDNRS